MPRRAALMPALGGTRMLLTPIFPLPRFPSPALPRIGGDPWFVRGVALLPRALNVLPGRIPTDEDWSRRRVTDPDGRRVGWVGVGAKLRTVPDDLVRGVVMGVTDRVIGVMARVMGVIPRDLVAACCPALP